MEEKEGEMEGMREEGERRERGGNEERKGEKRKMLAAKLQPESDVQSPQVEEESQLLKALL